jgi:predicted nuclease with TOPRIM domain
MFNDSTATFTLSLLIERRDEMARGVAELSSRLDQLRSEQQDLETAVTALRRLFGETHAATYEELVNEALEPGPTAAEDIRAEDASESPKPQPPQRRRKIRSTQAVTDYLAAVRVPKTREDILNHFRETGVAVLWKYPENATSTAIARAVEAGNVRELEDGKFLHASILREGGTPLE